MLTEGHIFSIKTKDQSNVADIKRGGSGIVITGLNVLRDQIRIGDFVFVVFGGDKPKGWTPGLVALAHVSKLPFCGDGDSGRTFRVEIDVDLYFQPSVKREDLVTYPDTFGTIGIGPITKWEPNQAITSVQLKNAVGLLQAICDLMPDKIDRIRKILGKRFALVEQPVHRYAEMKSNVGNPKMLFGGSVREQMNVQPICDIALKLFAQHRSADDWADGYRAVNVGVREYFGKLTAEKVAALDAAGLTELFEGVKDGEGKRTFMPMWGGSPGNGYSHIKGAIGGAADEVRAFLMRIQRDTALVSQFTRKDFARPGGFGKSVVSELLMKFHPDSALLYDSKTRDALKFLGCADFEPKVDFDETEYTRVMGIAAEIKSRMADMGIARTLEDAADARERDTPDYLTVNEFVAWVVGHKDLIKEEIDMGNINNLKRVEEKPKYEVGAKGLEAFGEDEMLKRLAAALKTKPFAILAGHSGTGKSQLVRRLAHMTCNVESLRKEADDTTLPGNYCMVQVKPNWHDSNDLLGYYSDMNGRHYRTTPFVEFVCKAYAYPDTPFFVCLDEMNLAPVEHYFAEYLSAIESADIKGDVYVTDPVVVIDSSAGADGKKKRDGAIAMEMMGGQASANAAEWLMAHDLTLPKNLFVVGTVNMDETTQQFSRKVLDRAMTILMDRVDFASMKKPEMPKCMNEDAVKFFLGHSVKTDALTPEQAGLLGNVNEVLKNTSFVVAYRFANEYALYQEAIELIDPSGKDEAGKAKRALDHMVMMKLLPRIHGERHDVAAIFGNEDGRDGLRKIVGSDGLSGVQMASILGRGGDYLTFWP